MFRGALGKWEGAYPVRGVALFGSLASSRYRRAGRRPSHEPLTRMSSAGVRLDRTQQPTALLTHFAWPAPSYGGAADKSEQ